MSVVWKDVPGYEGKYLVSNDGQVYSRVTSRMLCPSICRGYAVVSLYRGREVKNCKVHRLVALAFLPNPDGKQTVNHIDENKLNNCATNLEWATIAEQNRHGTRVVRAARAKSREIEQYSPSGELIRAWPSMAAVERVLGIRRGNIWACCEGRIASAGGFIWKRSQSK